MLPEGSEQLKRGDIASIMRPREHASGHSKLGMCSCAVERTRWSDSRALRAGQGDLLSSLEGGAIREAAELSHGSEGSHRH